MMMTKSKLSLLTGSAALFVFGWAVLGIFDKPVAGTGGSAKVASEAIARDDIGTSNFSDNTDVTPVARESGELVGFDLGLAVSEPSLATTDPVDSVYAPTNEEAIAKYGSVTSWQLHLLESEDQEAFPDWIDQQFDAGMADTEKSLENVEMISNFLAQAGDQGYTGQPVVECSAMICRLEFDGASDLRSLTRMIGQDLVALPEDIAGFHGMRRGPNRELIIFAPLKGILGTDL
ncbi:MAG: hypothetical protein AAFR91_10945 [Pseudomonadota bacterium]